MDLQSKFYQLEEVLSKSPESISIHSGMPYIMLIYNPRDEYLLQQEKRALLQKLNDLGGQYTEIILSKKIFEWIEGEGLLEKVFELEKTHKDELTKQLSSIIKEKLISHLIQISKGNTQAIIFLSRVGSLYPFLRVSTILSEIENKVKNIVVVFYPGKKEGKSLRFLNESEGYYYRAMLI